MDISVGLDTKKLDAIYKECNLDGPKQDQMRRFVLAIFDTDYNAAEAMRLAGYEGELARQRGWQYMQDARIRKAIQLLGVELGKHNMIRVDYVLRKMLKGADQAEKDNNLAALARFLEMIGKHLGMFSEKIELTGKDGDSIKIEQRTQEDVSAFKSAIDGLAKRGGEGDPSPVTKH